jgi:hypothetical protein
MNQQQGPGPEGSVAANPFHKEEKEVRIDLS